MKTLVLGGGIVGVTTAYFLAQAGHEVTLLGGDLKTDQVVSKRGVPIQLVFGESGFEADILALGVAEAGKTISF